jgi:hypothetical protein
MGSASPEKNRLDYRQEARDIRATAWELREIEAREQLFMIASLYDKLADLSDRLIPSLNATLSDCLPRKVGDKTGTTDAMQEK